MNEAVADSYLMLAAYVKWREACPEHILGEFAFAIWDARERRLFCCRDHFGTQQLFYWQNGTRFLFASDVRTILACPGVRRELNRRKLAGMVIFDGEHFHPEDTFHVGIRALPSASSLTVCAQNLTLRTYWEPSIRTEIVPRNAEDAFEALRHLLFEAVECRIPEGAQTALELSGGLDSSGIAGIAARYLEKKGRTLLAVSGVLPEGTDPAQRYKEDERSYIDEFRSWPNIRIEYVTAPGRGPFDGIEDSSLFFATPVRTSRFYMMNALHEAALAQGANTVLRGLSGELGPTCRAKSYYVELAATLRWRELARALIDAKRVLHIHPFRFLCGQILSMIRPFRWERDPHLLLTPSFRRYGKPWQYKICYVPDQRAQQLNVLRNFLRSRASWWAYSNDVPIRTSQPWLDKRVVEFCLSAPPDLKLRNGYQRNLIREALNGLLPKRIQWRTDKTPFSPNYSFRYNQQLSKAQNFVAGISRGDPVREIIDIDRLTALMKPVDPQSKGVVQREIIPVNIYTLCFLRQFSSF